MLLIVPSGEYAHKQFPRCGRGANGCRPQAAPHVQRRRPGSSCVPAARTTDSNNLKIVQSPEGVLIIVQLPGLTHDDISVLVKDRTLTISAELKSHPNPRDAALRVHVSERSRPRFHKDFRLGDHADTDHISARLEAGVLTVLVPYKEKAAPRTIQVNGPAPSSADHAGPSYDADDAEPVVEPAVKLQNVEAVAEDVKGKAPVMAAQAVPQENTEQDGWVEDCEI